MKGHWHRLLLALLLATAFLLWPTVSSAQLRIRWDCYMPSANVDCEVLRSSLTSKIPFLEIVDDPRVADVLVTLTSVPAENGTRFNLTFTGKRVDGYGTEVHTTDRIPSSVDATTAMVRVMTKLERGLADFMDQKIDGEVRDGALTLKLLDPVSMPFAGRPEQDAVRWYFAPGLGAYFSDVAGVGVNASGSPSLSFNYSGLKWRTQQSMSFNYSEQSQPVPGTAQTATIRFVGGNVLNVVSRSIGPGGHWSAGLLLSAEKNPQANYEFRANGSLGIEFDLIPRQTVNQRNFGFRCGIGPELQRYDATNVEGLDEQLVGRQFCDLFLSWHFMPVDVWANLGETSILEDFAYRALAAGVSATWRLTDDLTVAPWVNVQQINRAINEAQPSTVVYSDPKQEIEASMLAAIQEGYTAPLGVQSGLTIRYLFGNGSLASEDQRWKNVSNLR